MTAVLPFRTKAELVYENLRERILSGELVPGSELSISGVARELGVSEIPVREGVQRLELEGLLHLEAHKTPRVRVVSGHDIEELLAIRTELESLAIRHAAEHISQSQLEGVRAILDQMGAAERGLDTVEYGRLNRGFHLAIYEAQPFRRLATMIRQLWDSTDWCRRIFVADADYVLASSAEHEGIYDALVARDGDRAAELLRRQKVRGCEWLLEHVASVSGRHEA